MSAEKKRAKVLVTGFGPFKGHDVNASWEAVKELAKNGVGDGIDLTIYEIPVVYDTVKKLVPEFWAKHSPDLFVGVGVSDYVSKFTLEQQAHNHGYTAQDVNDCPAENFCCIVGEEDVLVSGIDMVETCSALNDARIAVETQLVVHVGVSSYASKLQLEQQAHNDSYDRLDVEGCTADGCCCVDGGDDVIIAGLDMKTVCDDVNCSGSKAKAEISLDAGRYLCDFSFFTSLHIDRNRSAFIHVPPLDNPYSVEELAEGLKAAILAMLKQLGL